MKMKKSVRHTMLPILCGLGGLLLGEALPASAATASVTITNFGFSPPTVNINVNDQVTWTWASGITPHSATSTTNSTEMWDSTLHSTPFTFSHTFSKGGSFPYFCTLHTFQTGVVNVQAANVPPTVSLSAPTNGATFAAPWTGTLQAAASDPDGSVSKVEFFAGTTSLGVVNNPGSNPSITVTNLAAGNYTLTAVATDNLGTATTSAGVSIHVVQPAQILLSAPRRLSGTSFQFSYSATPGLNYVIDRSGQLPNFAPIATNPATLSTQTFQDNSATGALNFYQVRLAPNP
jgi:plastocyanin